MKYKLTIALFSLLLIFEQASARPHRPAQIPNGTINSCANCHVNPNGGGERNAFGKLVEARFLNNGNVVWGPVLASLDADGDGISNGMELQDTYGSWQQNEPAPGNSDRITLPGVASSSPASTAVLHFTGMTPHNGQKLELRAINISSMKEVFRETVSSVTAEFDITIQNIVLGQSYMIDFYADFNQNDRYDAPPADHAWRLFLMDAQGDDELNFVHNTAFTDIEWKNLLSVQFTGMTPHLGQLLELRVEDDGTSEEIGRVRVEAISEADFVINIPGIVPGHEYNIDFYADFNGNGTYDAPPTDHAWQLKVENTDGDETVDFAHNTTFTDINWKYLFTLNFLDMNPHIGELFELRVVRQDDGAEVGRISLDSIIIPIFSVSVPGIEPGHNYNADFYADFNGNRLYDAPPIDHAYRIEFTTTTGDYIENFLHNTNFTDINWPGEPTGIEEENNKVPEKYSLKQNYPNPFNPATRISYDLPSPGIVTLKIYNTLGKEVALLVNGEQPSGSYTVDFDASAFPSGVYFYELRTNNFVQTRKMLLLR